MGPCGRWRDPDSNRGHHDFQSCALPTELSRQRGARLAPTGLRRSVTVARAMTGTVRRTATRRCSSASASWPRSWRPCAGTGVSRGPCWSRGPPGSARAGCWPSAAARRRARRADVWRRAGRELERDFAFGVVRQLFEAVLADPERARERLLAGAAAPAAPSSGRRDAGARPGDALVRGAARPLLAGAQPRRATAAAARRRRPALVRPRRRCASSPTSARRLDGAPVLVARGPAQRRARHRPGAVAELADDPPTRRASRPGPLSAAAVARAARGAPRRATPDAAFAAACHRGHRRQPAAAAPAAHALRRGRACGRWRATPSAVRRDRPARGRRAPCSLRLARLAADAIAVAQAVAVLGDSAELPPSPHARRPRRGGGGATPPARSRRAEILRPDAAARRSCTRWSATRSTTSCRPPSASCSTPAPRACCAELGAPAEQWRRTCSPRRARRRGSSQRAARGGRAAVAPRRRRDGGRAT